MFRLYAYDKCLLLTAFMPTLAFTQVSAKERNRHTVIQVPLEHLILKYQEY